MAAAILNHNLTAGQANAGTIATPMAAANPASSSSSSSSSSATISANDFLTLLVTEMKNQDPTATTDPNEYINQLVNVNSLQQLIAINQTLTTAYGSSTTAAGNVTPTGSGSATSNQTAASAQAQPASSSGTATLPGAISAAANQLAPGNLGIPAVNPAAQSVAQALSGRPRVQ
jgi:flagellar basal-body rod modification protein FlgD